MSSLLEMATGIGATNSSVVEDTVPLRTKLLLFIASFHCSKPAPYCLP